MKTILSVFKTIIFRSFTRPFYFQHYYETQPHSFTYVQTDLSTMYNPPSHIKSSSYSIKIIHFKLQGDWQFQVGYKLNNYLFTVKEY